MLRREDRAPVELQFARHPPTTADRMLAEHHAMFGRLDCERAQVEQLVVQRALRQSVGLDVRPADVVPLDVRCLQTCGREPDAEVEPADAAPVLVGSQHLLPEAGVPATPLRVCGAGRGWRCLAHFARPVKVQSQAGHDVGMQRQREVGDRPCWLTLSTSRR